MNTMKTVFLMTVLTLILVAAGGMMGGRSGMTMALILAGAMNFFSYWFSHKIVLAMYGAKPVSEAEAPELYSMLRRLTSRARLPMPQLYLIQQDQPNAFATGRNPEHGVVAVTTGIVRMLSMAELEGVVAHELAHIKNRDILIGSIAATIAGAISYMVSMAQWAMIFGMGRGDDDEGGNPLVMFVVLMISSVAAMMVQMAVSRSREYEADKTGAEICGNPHHLADALAKLQMASERIPMQANPATAHMFIVNPLSGGAVMRLFSTHPPMEERIARLRAMRHR